MEKERRRGGPVDNLREYDPETANPAGVDVEKQRLGVGWRPGTTTGLTQERKQISSDVSDETIEAREKLSSLNQWQQMQAEKNREKAGGEAEIFCQRNTHATTQFIAHTQCNTSPVRQSMSPFR